MIEKQESRNPVGRTAGRVRPTSATSDTARSFAFSSLDGRTDGHARARALRAFSPIAIPIADAPHSCQSSSSSKPAAASFVIGLAFIDGPSTPVRVLGSERETARRVGGRGGASASSGCEHARLAARRIGRRHASRTAPTITGFSGRVARAGVHRARQWPCSTRLLAADATGRAAGVPCTTRTCRVSLARHHPVLSCRSPPWAELLPEREGTSRWPTGLAARAPECELQDPGGGGQLPCCWPCSVWCVPRTKVGRGRGRRTSSRTDGAVGGEGEQVHSAVG